MPALHSQSGYHNWVTTQHRLTLPHEGIDDRTVYVYSIIKYIYTGDDLDMDVEMVEYVADKLKLFCFMDILFLIQDEDAQNQIKDHRHPADPPLQNVNRSIINVKGFCGK